MSKIVIHAPDGSQEAHQVSDRPKEVSKPKLPTHKPVAPPPEVKKHITPPKVGKVEQLPTVRPVANEVCGVCAVGPCNAHTVIKNIKE